MDFKLRILAVCSLGLLLGGGVAWADTRYVSDELIITVRQGKGNEYKILKTIKSNTAMQVLEEDNTYLKVRLDSGLEGYVLRQYVTNKIPKPIIIEQLEKERDVLKQKLAKWEAGQNGLQDELDSLRQQDKISQADLNSTRQQLEKITSQYESLKEKSANVMQLSEERDQMQTENARLTQEVQQLRGENKDLLRTGMIRWFLAGGGVFFFGWISGKISRRKKRSSF